MRSYNKSGKFICSKCGRIVSEHRRRRHRKKRCGIKPLPKGMKRGFFANMTFELLQKIRRELSRGNLHAEDRPKKTAT